MNDKKKPLWKETIFFFSFFIIIYLVFLATNRIDSHHYIFQDWINGNFTDELYLYPTIKYIGTIGQQIMGNSFFYIYPFTLFLLALAIIKKTFKTINQEQMLIPLLFLFNLKAIEAIAFFTRENTFFLLSSIYCYFFFKILYKKQPTKKNYLLLVTTNALMFLFRETAIIFAILTMAAITWKFRKKIKITIPGTKILFPGFLIETQSGLAKMYNYSLSAPFDFKPQNLFTFLQIPIFSISTFTLLFKRDIFHLLTITLTIAYCFVLVTVIGNSDIIIRYTSGLIPLHMLYIAKTIGFKKLT